MELWGFLHLFDMRVCGCIEGIFWDSFSSFFVLLIRVDLHWISNDTNIIWSHVSISLALPSPALSVPTAHTHAQHILYYYHMMIIHG